MKTDYVTPEKPSNGRNAIWVFTPSRTDPKDLEFILVQRQKLLQDAVERVRESALTDHKHHLLFVGPRGCGKTHLVTLIVSRLCADEALTNRLRIAWLNEDETCTTLLEFLVKIHSALVKRYPNEYREDMLDAAYELKQDAAQEFVSQRLLASLGSRALVVVTENLDTIFEGLGDAGQKQLRAFIQEHPKLAFVATAQRLVEDLSSRTSPFFGFFQTEHLKPLNVEEATELLQNIARLQENGSVAAFLSTSRGRSRVRAIHHLSGGNHRIYIVLSQFITRDSIESLLGPFMKMVDELTPYYQERIRWLSPLQRKIVEYLCVCENTVPVKEIAKRLFATPQTISSQLQDLRERGYVESNQRGREFLYEISEPLMRICVEVKDNQRNQPLRLLVDFLRVWYDDRELKHHLGKMEPASASRAYLESAIVRNSAEGNLRKHLILEDLKLYLPEQDDLLRELKNQPEAVAQSILNLSEGNETEALKCLDEAIADESTLFGKAELLLVRSRLYSVSGEHQKEIDDYTAVIGLSGAPVEQVAIALIYRSNAYSKAGDTQRAIEDYTSVIGLSGAPVAQVAMALVNRGVAHGQAGETQREIEDYTAVVGLSGASVKQVAVALVNRGIAYSKAGKTQIAIEDYTAVIGISDAPVEQVAWALVIRGLTHWLGSKKKRAIEDFTAVIGLSGVPIEWVARARYSRGVTFFKESRKSEAQADFEALVYLQDAPAKQVVDSYLALAELHFSEGRWSEGFQTLEAGLERGSKEQPPYHGTATDLISVVFAAGLSPEGRRDKVGNLLGCYNKHRALPVLGEAVVQHIGQVFRTGEPFPSSDNLEGWALAWEQAAESVPEFRLSVRLLRTGINFVKVGGNQPGILLDLTSPERAILAQALGLEKIK
jgi:tetratricopeptide (TPR) repeat protein